MFKNTTIMKLAQGIKMMVNKKTKEATKKPLSAIDEEEEEEEK